MLGALRLTRSFLLLEDDYDVDWEVDRNEPAETLHPHRVALRGHSRPGVPGSRPNARTRVSPLSSNAGPARALRSAGARSSAPCTC